MSLTPRRLLATALPILAAVLCTPAVAAEAASTDTWTLLDASPAGVNHQPVFALTADPGNPADVVYGTAAGTVYRSTDSGATFTQVASGLGQGVLALAFDPIEPTHVLAGTRGAGIWRSDDSGATWHALDNGTETVRAFAFSMGLSAAATDAGVLVTEDGDTWKPADLSATSIDAVAAGDGHLLAGADVGPGTSLSMFASSDSGASWNPVVGPASGGSMVSALTLTSGHLLLGTNVGLFSSGDGGSTWSALSSSAALPQTDYSQVVGSGSNVYAASDGGASDAGGLWASGDGGQTFRSLNPPVHTVTGLAASGSTLYVATWRPLDGSVMLWTYVDGGGTPQGPTVALPSPAPVAAAPAETQPRVDGRWLQSLAAGPEGPYLVLGVGAVLVMLLALVAYLRRGGS